jgi:uncharacterized membrane protein YidH (DUF202 family)
MNRAWIVLIIGTAIALLGIFLRIEAEHLATTWQLLDSSTWGGETDVGRKGVYQAVGCILAIFGLALDALAVERWLNERLGEPQPHSRTRSNPHFYG